MMSAPIIKIDLINNVSKMIDECQSLNDTEKALIGIELLEDYFPEEVEVINIMRSDLHLITTELNK